MSHNSIEEFLPLCQSNVYTIKILVNFDVYNIKFKKIAINMAWCLSNFLLSLNFIDNLELMSNAIRPKNVMTFGILHTPEKMLSFMFIQKGPNKRVLIY